MIERQGVTGKFLLFPIFSILIVGCSPSTRTLQSNHQMPNSVPQHVQSNNSLTSEPNKTVTEQSGSKTGDNSVSRTTQNEGQSVSPSLVLYGPTLVGLDEVQISGHVFDIEDSSTKLTVTASYPGEQVARVDVPVMADGSFQSVLDLSSIGGRYYGMYFGVQYPGAVSQGVRRYLYVYRMDHGMPAPIAEGVNWLKANTQVPVEAPAWIPEYFSTVSTNAPFLSVQTSANSLGYQLKILRTIFPYGLNDKVALQLSPGMSDNTVSEITCTVLKDESDTQKFLHMYQPQEQGLPISVELRQLTGRLYQGSSNVLEWQEGLWDLTVEGKGEQQVLNVGSQIVDELNQIYLPPTNGTIAVQLSSDGSVQDVHVSYVRKVPSSIGVEGYRLSGQSDLSDVLHMASSMTVVKPSSTKPEISAMTR